MKKQITSIFSVLALTCAVVGHAQDVRLQPCVTYGAMEQVFASDPSALIRYNKVQAQLMMEGDMPQAKSSAFEYTVPVVFHVLHQGGVENISDATVQQALTWMQMDFDATSSDKGTVAQPFQSMWIDSDIKFMLAHKDPQGNCTNGIVHHYDKRTMWERDGQLYYNTPLYAGLTWDPTRYLNIIVVKDVVDNDPNSDVIGYTFKPGTHGSGDTRDAVVMTASFMGSFIDVRFMTHEVGHWLNLSHPWGDTNDPGLACGDDFVCDTPPTKGKLGGCDPSGSGNTCATTATCGYSAGMQNTENIMDYSNCHKNFTAGQTARMRTTLASNVSGRSNLWSPANIVATNVDGSSACPPRADFTSVNESYTICAGGSLTFKDYSYNGAITNYQWSGTNVVVSNPTSSVTSILFPASGTATVTLTVSNNLGAGFKNKTVTVLDGLSQVMGPWYESFEIGVIPQEWKVENPNASSGTYIHNWDAAYDGGASVVLKGANSAAGQVDILNTPIIDMASSDIKQLSFAYAYARKTNSTNDMLKVQATGDCGSSWVDIYVQSANQLSNGSGGVQSSNYVPTAEQWKKIELSTFGAWNTFTNNPHVTVRFMFTQGTSGAGNNFWLDAINIPSEVGISEFKNEIGLSVFPNPSEDMITVQYNLSVDSDVKAGLTDLSGRQLMQVNNGKMRSGSHSLSVNENGTLAKGVYLLNFEVNGVKMSEKVIIR